MATLMFTWVEGGEGAGVEGYKGMMPWEEAIAIPLTGGGKERKSEYRSRPFNVPPHLNCFAVQQVSCFARQGPGVKSGAGLPMLHAALLRSAVPHCPCLPYPCCKA